MSRLRIPNAAPHQLGFDALLASAETENTNRALTRQCAHLPGTYEEALPYLHNLIAKHHAAMLAGDAATAMPLRAEADSLALKLNNFEPGIIADEHSPGRVLERRTAAPDGTVPLWGQSGSFETAHKGMRIRIVMESLFGIAADAYPWLGFEAHALEWDKPFLSETGFRSFIAIGGDLVPGFTPECFALEAIAAHIRQANKGKLFTIKPEYRKGPRAAELQGKSRKKRR
jgi:hypothetical protein